MLGQCVPLRQAVTATSTTPKHGIGEKVPIYNTAGNPASWVVYVRAQEAIGAVGSALWLDLDTQTKVIDTLPTAGDIYGWAGIACAAAAAGSYFWMQVEGPTLVGIATSAAVAERDVLFPDAAGTWDTQAPATQAEVDAAKGRMVATGTTAGAETLAAGSAYLNP